MRLNCIKVYYGEGSSLVVSTSDCIENPIAAKSLTNTYRLPIVLDPELQSSLKVKEDLS